MMFTHKSPHHFLRAVRHVSKMISKMLITRSDATLPVVMLLPSPMYQGVRLHYLNQLIGIWVAPANTLLVPPELLCPATCRGAPLVPGDVGPDPALAHSWEKWVQCPSAGGCPSLPGWQHILRLLLSLSPFHCWGNWQAELLWWFDWQLCSWIK